jgi:hypothetical protein
MEPAAAGGETRRMYHCTRCGNCCKWPGIVRLTEADIAAMADHLGLSEARFIAEYTQLSPERNGLVLTDREDGACVMLEGDNRCRVYPVRPGQCRTFPNGWSFPGFELECPAIRLTYTMRRLNGDGEPPRQERQP